MKKDETKLTCGMVIKEAREAKGMTVNDLAFEISIDKEKVKEYEKKIIKWEKDKDYPDMKEIYLLANAIEVNPTDLMILRDRHRKTLAKKDKEKKISKIDVDELKEYLYYIAAFLGKFVPFLGIIAFSVTFARLFKVAMVGDDNGEGFDREVGNVIVDYMNSIDDDSDTNNSTENNSNYVFENTIDNENLTNKIINEIKNENLY